jgi:O-antigen/teichoic acid export membrane protein
MIPGLLVSSAFPILARAARDDTTRLAYAVQRLFEILFLLGLGVALCTAVGADLAIRVVAGSKFEPSVDVLRIQAIALFASFLLAVWGFALLSLSLYRGILVANAAALVVSVALTLALAPSHGAEGAAVSTVVGEATLAIGYAVVLLRTRRDLDLSFGVVPRAVAATALAAAVLLVPGLSQELRLITVAAVFGLAAWLLGAIPDEIGIALRPRRGE